MPARRTLIAILLLLVAFVAAGFAADRRARSRVSPDSRAAQLARAGKVEGAEQLYWALLQQGPVTVPMVVSFLNAHERAIFDASPMVVTDRASVHEAPHLHTGPAVDEAAIDAFLARTDLPEGVSLLGRYWRGVVRDGVDPDLENEVKHAADAEPPLAWANHLLAENAVRNARIDDAATLFLREGASYPGSNSDDDPRAKDVNNALSIWVDAGAWERVNQALRDPRVEAHAQPWLQLGAAVRGHDWKRAVHAWLRCLPPAVTLGTGILAAISALAWGTFCARLGGLGKRPKVRGSLYVAAFVLGFASVTLTLAIVALEEGLLQMTESGDPMRDALFFTFGVGLREEVSKLVFFLPLLPFLRRYGTRLDVLVCGALVGLGFAAEENLGYLLHAGDLSTGMARFLTANFFHMSMTAILAGALDDLLRSKEEASMRFSLALLTVAAMHGAYDYFLSVRADNLMRLLPIIIFFLLARQFLGLVSVARAKERLANSRIVETFGVGMAFFVVGTSFVYASALVGPGAAASALAAGLIDLGFIILVLVRAMREV